MVRFLNCNQATLLSHWAMNPRAHPEAFEQIMKQQKAYNKNMVPKKAPETHAGSVGFLQVLFFPFFSILSFPNVQKLRGKKKNQSCEKNLG